LPVLYKKEGEEKEFSERDLLYKVLFDMKKDIHELKMVVGEITREGELSPELQKRGSLLISRPGKNEEEHDDQHDKSDIHHHTGHGHFDDPIQEPEVVDEPLSLQDKEIDMIRKALKKYNGKRKSAARELGISERTLYRKIKEYNIEK